MEDDGQFLQGVIPDQTPLDPNQFAVPWDTAFEALAFIVILSFVVERFLSLLFESQPFVEFRKKQLVQASSTHKELFAFVLSVVMCWLYDVDLLAILMSHAHTSFFGIFLTAGVVAGGSKGSIKLFREILGFKSGAYKEYEEFKKQHTLQKNDLTNASTQDAKAKAHPPSE